MAICTLLAPPTDANLPAWEFEHAMAHRNVLGAMSPDVPPDPIGGKFFGTAGLTGFTAVPYFIDPQHNNGIWHLDHGQAHTDYATTLPNFFGFEVTGEMNPTNDFVDTDLRREEMLQWWTFSNHQQHMIAMDVLPETLRFPFW